MVPKTVLLEESLYLILAPSGLFDWVPKLYIKQIFDSVLQKNVRNYTKLSSSDNFLLKRSFVNWWWLYHEMARCQLLRRRRRQWHGPMIIRERFYSNSSKGVISKNDSVFDVVICWFNKKYFFFLLVWTVFLCVSHWLSGSFYLF